MSDKTFLGKTKMIEFRFRDFFFSRCRVENLLDLIFVNGRLIPMIFFCGACSFFSFSALLCFRIRSSVLRNVTYFVLESISSYIKWDLEFIIFITKIWSVRNLSNNQKSIRKNMFFLSLWLPNRNEKSVFLSVLNFGRYQI
uniref:Uncharacterized protein n=1 Tax=Cacopsylla melanoneura TaxID=428564 RepID=A0A8D8PMD2_9HEMI